MEICRDDTADIATVFADLAAILYDGSDIDAIYTAVASATPLLVLGCDHASVMIFRGEEFVTVAASDDIARRIDGFERLHGEGPCVDAIVEQPTQLDADMRVHSTWPALARDIIENTPVRGSAGFRMVVENRKLGALNVFSDTPGALTDQSVDQACILAAFASVASTAAADHREASTLRQGMASNREIDKAIGLLTAFHNVSDDEAVQFLRAASQELNIKLADIGRPGPETAPKPVMNTTQHVDSIPDDGPHPGEFLDHIAPQNGQ